MYPGGAAVSSAASHGDPEDLWRANGGGGGTEGRGDLHGQVRAGQGSVPLGPLWEERSGQLLLDARIAAMGGEGMGVGIGAAYRAGGDRGFPGWRSGPADRHGQGVQRGADAAVPAAGGS